MALKLLAPGAGGADPQRRLDYEARILARLRHPGIAEVYEIGAFETDFGARPFIAMELVNGAPLTDYAAERDLPLDERAALLAAVAEAAHFAHQRGVIHLDLKPANVLAVDSPGGTGGERALVKIVDFGVARLVEGAWMHTLMTAPQQIAGTLPYMSPEQQHLGVIGRSPGSESPCPRRRML